MSFILDALKKSESDRQQKASPGIADVPTASGAATTPRWIPALVLLLLVNLGAVGYLMLRPADAPEPVSAAPVAAPPAPAPAPRTMPATVAPSTAQRSSPPAARPAEVPVAASIAPAETAAVDTPGFDRISPEPVIADPAPTNYPAAPESTMSTPAETEDESWLTLNDLRASGRVDLPDMHIDLHVFSDNPADRFVFIDMKEYRESATLPEGPTVKQITTEGVVLEYRGTTFLLPRE